jgi:response regulator of citrate/malate metabolism
MIEHSRGHNGQPACSQVAERGDRLSTLKKSSRSHTVKLWTVWARARPSVTLKPDLVLLDVYLPDIGGSRFRTC